MFQASLPQVEPAYLSITEIARYTSLSESTIRALMRDPLEPLPSFLVGRARRFSRLAVTAWMERQAARQQGTAKTVAAVLKELRASRSSAD